MLLVGMNLVTVTEDILNRKISVCSVGQIWDFLRAIDATKKVKILQMIV